MDLATECYPCLMRQVVNASRLSGLTEEQSRMVLDHTMRMLLDLDKGLVPLHVVTHAYRYMRETFFAGHVDFDPYKELKRDANAGALAHLEEMESMVLESDSPLDTALRIAAAGNIIDYGAKDHGSISIEEEIEHIGELSFGVYDRDSFIEQLSTAKAILYIGDNAGEIVFDKVLLRAIRREYPQTTILFATRDIPIINDITLTDAHDVGMEEVADVISSGSHYPGTILAETNDQFRGAYGSADLVISKGQGNFESLGDEVDTKLFFIMRVKCARVAGITGVAIGDVVLLRNSRS